MWPQLPTFEGDGVSRFQLAQTRPPGVRERVEAVALELRYAGQDPNGRTLSSGKVNAIGVMPIENFGITLFTCEYGNVFPALRGGS